MWLLAKTKHILHCFGKTHNEHRQPHCRITSSSSTMLNLDTRNRPTGGGVTLRVPVLVSYGCYNKLPLSLWLNTTPMYYLTVLEIRSPNWVLLGKKQDVGRAEFLWTLEGRICFLTVPAFRDCCILWLLAPLHLQSQRSHPSDLCFCWLDLLLWCWFFCLFPL